MINLHKIYCDLNCAPNY